MPKYGLSGKHFKLNKMWRNTSSGTIDVFHRGHVLHHVVLRRLAFPTQTLHPSSNKEVEEEDVLFFKQMCVLIDMHFCHIRKKRGIKVLRLLKRHS